MIRLAKAIGLCGALAAISGKAQAIPNFPALDLAIGNNKSYFTIVAQEVPISTELAYSCNYSSRRGRFVPPEFFNFTLHGYHNLPEWKAIKFVDFKIGSQQFSGKPTYKVVGPERIRTLDDRDSNYVESLTLKLPANIARQIAHSKTGVSITLGFSSSSIAIPAPKLNRFKQLIDSVAVYSKRETSKSGPTKVASPGLPLKEVFHNELKMLETADSHVNHNYAIQAMAATAYRGHKLTVPKVAFLVIAFNEEPLWANVNSITISYSGKKLRLPSKARNAEENNGISVEVMTTTLPYRDFIAISKATKFYVTVGNDSFEVNKHHSTGLRELARRISQ